jgi:ferredoxin
MTAVFNGKTAEEINKQMAHYLPELASKYATYPLHRDRWLQPQEKGDKGEPCYIKAAVDEGLKMDYVFGAGPYGFGYYSLLTKASYQNLWSKINTLAPTDCLGCFACGKAARKAYDEWDDVKRIVHNRQAATIPDDVKGAQDALIDAQNTAEAHEMYNNNIGLTHNVVTNMNF